MENLQTFTSRNKAFIDWIGSQLTHKGFICFGQFNDSNDIFRLVLAKGDPRQASSFIHRKLHKFDTKILAEFAEEKFCLRLQ